MNAKNVLCKKCGGFGVIHGSDYLNDEGPWRVACNNCGEETVAWAYQREAWRQWKVDNQKDSADCPCEHESKMACDQCQETDTGNPLNNR